MTAYTTGGFFIHSAGASHRGAVRTRNEDAVLCDIRAGYWVIADGMGGYGFGDVAADLLIDAVEAETDLQAMPRTVLPGRPSNSASRLAGALRNGNRIIVKEAQSRSAQMGATVVALAAEKNLATLIWAGDSRAYLLRHQHLTQLTKDHSFVQELVDQGKIDANKAAQHPERNVVTRAAGASPELELDEVAFEMKHGDRLLLCSDGLPEALPADRISTLLYNAMTPEHATQTLVYESLERGAPDNVSAIVLFIQEKV